ncbi:MAG: hypothetical protein ACI9UK_000911 [Candidatus Krumholzibacteriia bacterium]|jgi:hypothetical protein
MTSLPVQPEEYRLNLGGTVISILCDPAEFAIGLSNWFSQPSATATPHIYLELELITHSDTPDFPNSLVTTKTISPNGAFDIAGGLITGHFDPTTGSGKLKAKGTLIRGPYMRILEQIFYQAFWSAQKHSQIDSFLIHSSAVIADGRGFLFVGPSEAGKSTVARLSSQHHVLGDEMNLVRFDDHGPVVTGTVFNGLFKEKKPGEAPLAGVFLLKQAPAHRLGEIPKLEAVPALAAEIVPPVGLNEVVNSQTLPQMIDFAERLVEIPTLKRLEFLPDEGLWQTIAAEFKLN